MFVIIHPTQASDQMFSHLCFSSCEDMRRNIRVCMCVCVCVCVCVFSPSLQQRPFAAKRWPLLPASVLPLLQWQRPFALPHLPPASVLPQLQPWPASQPKPMHVCVYMYVCIYMFSLVPQCNQQDLHHRLQHRNQKDRFLNHCSGSGSKNATQREGLRTLGGKCTKTMCVLRHNVHTHTHT
jgi:hypothetical protein